MSLPAASSVSDALTRQRHRAVWKRLAPAGLTGIGLGVSLVGEATLRKGRSEPFAAYGTVALCVLGAGVCLFDEAVKRSALAERA